MMGQLPWVCWAMPTLRRVASGSRMMAALLGSVGGEEAVCVRVWRLCFMRVVAWRRVWAMSCSRSSASMS
jgi:hypothetical protein